MLFLQNNYQIIINDDPGYNAGSTDNTHAYDIEYTLGDSQYRPSSQHSVVVKDDVHILHSCVLLAVGGATGIHTHSALLYGDSCIVAIGPFLCSLCIPSLEIEWQVRVDTMTCFDVHYSVKHDCLISHGELEIARIERDGTVCWKASGADIFTNGLKLRDDYIEVVDFNGKHYRMEIDTGTT